MSGESPDICPALKPQENGLPKKSAPSINLKASHHSASKKRPISTRPAVPVAADTVVLSLRQAGGHQPVPVSPPSGRSSCQSRSSD